MPSFPVADIANWFLASFDREAGDGLTQLKLQKLVYYAQAWHLATKGQPLFEEDIQAWAHGPVVPSLYRKYRTLGFELLPRPKSVPELPAKVVRFLELVKNVYGESSAKNLERMTHGDEPWIKARGSLTAEERSTAVIPKAHMKKFYSDKLKGR